MIKPTSTYWNRPFAAVVYDIFCDPLINLACDFLFLFCALHAHIFFNEIMKSFNFIE